MTSRTAPCIPKEPAPDMPRRRPPMFCAPNAYFQIFVWAEHSSEIAVESPLRGVQPLRPLLCLGEVWRCFACPLCEVCPLSFVESLQCMFVACALHVCVSWLGGARVSVMETKPNFCHISCLLLMRHARMLHICARIRSASTRDSHAYCPCSTCR